MMKSVLFCMLTTLVSVLALSQSVKVSTTYSFPPVGQDAVLNGLKSIRGCTVGDDIDGDGRKEIAVTNYAGNGRVCIFEAVGNDSIQLVWTSPAPTTGGGGSTPRYVLFGDLDNDGIGEVIFQINNWGILIYEWDGVVGSDNYGTQPSQVIGSTFLLNVTGNTEYMEVVDIDGDGTNELLCAFNANSNPTDAYYSISAIGEWTTGDPGFSSFSVEYQGIRTDLGTYGINGGTPYAMIAANFDGTGNKEVLIHNWNLKNVVPMRVPGTDNYQLSDTTNGKQNYQIGMGDDLVALFGGLAYDIDNDGREEVYLPTYVGSIIGPNNGKVHMISYEPGQSTAEIDSSNVTALDATSVLGDRTTFGYGYGDIDGDGKKEIYTSTSYPFNVISLEFQGGDKRDPNNWTSRLLYAGDSTIISDVLDITGAFVSPALIYKDSLGVLDTLKRVEPAFASKIFGHFTDIDNDGLEDIILPYQALQDSFTIASITWNIGSARYDTVYMSPKTENPKRWGLRIIERDMGTGVRGKELTLILPEHYKLGQNYPNPFNPTTTITYTLPVATKISLKIYDVLGKEVKTLINGELKEPGEAAITWNGTNNQGVQVVSGTYFYTLTFGNFSKTNKMMLLR